MADQSIGIDDYLRSKLFGIPLPIPGASSDMTPLPQTRMSVEDLGATPPTEGAQAPAPAGASPVDQIKATNIALQGAVGKNQAAFVKQQGKTETSSKHVSPAFLTPDEAGQLSQTVDKLRATQAQGLADQEAGIKQQLRDLGLMAMVKPNVDLTPGYYLANALSDKNNRQEIPHPSTNGAQAQVNDLLNMENKIQSQRGSVSRAETGLIKAPMGGFNTSALQTMLENSLGIQPQRPVVPPTSSAISKDADAFMKDTQGPRDAISAAQNARTELAGNTGTMTNALRVALTGLAGMRSGRMPLAEIQGFGGDPALLNRIEQVTSKLTAGAPLTALDQKQIRTYIDAIDGLNRKKMQDLASGREANFNAFHPGQSAPTDYAQRLIKQAGGLPPPVSAPAAQGMPNRSDFKSVDEYKAALKKYVGH